MRKQAKETPPATLRSWKEIADYLGKGIRTVQRWEDEYQLPVRRPMSGGRPQAVFAYTRELDAWLKSVWLQRSYGEIIRLHNLIRTAHELKDVHDLLMHENWVALTALLASCDELKAIDHGKSHKPRRAA